MFIGMFDLIWTFRWFKWFECQHYEWSFELLGTALLRTGVFTPKHVESPAASSPDGKQFHQQSKMGVKFMTFLFRFQTLNQPVIL